MVVVGAVVSCVVSYEQTSGVLEDASGVESKK
jgi:hypothetical protein